jgi:hypothetical protein
MPIPTYFYYKHLRRTIFQRSFVSILFNKNLDYGARCFALSLLTVAPQSRVKLNKMARKLGTHPPAITKWKKQLEAAGCLLRPMDPLEVSARAYEEALKK